MMSLFSSFDYKLFSPFLMMFMVLTTNLNSQIYLISGKKLMFIKFFKIMGSFVLSLKMNKFNKLMKMMMISIMILLISLNIPAVLSYNFALTSQMGPVLFMASSIWLAYILMTLTKSAKNLICHFIPEGTPIYLTWFLVMVEMISNLIRPLTVTVRLVANILAGHLLMIMLSKLALMHVAMVLMYTALNLVELFVALIQAYIFMTMLTLYYSELE